MIYHDHNEHLTYIYVRLMGGSRKKVAQFNVLLELQLITSLVISQIPVESANTRVGKSHIGGGGAPPPLAPLKSAYGKAD